MAREKGTKRVSELQTVFNPSTITVVKMMDIFKALKISETFSAFDYIKECGYSFKLVLSLLIIMVVMAKKTVYASLAGLGKQLLLQHFNHFVFFFDGFVLLVYLMVS